MRCNRIGAVSKFVEKSKIFYAFGVVTGSRRPIPLERTLADSRAKLKKILQDKNPPPPRPKPLTRHLEDWRKTLALSGITLRQQEELSFKVTSILADAGALHAAGVTAETVRDVFTRWENTKPRWAAQTRVHYLKALNQFLRHAGLPLIRIKLPVPRHHRVLCRGALTMEQAAQLLTGTRASTRLFRGLTGQQRELIYRLILTTGLRRGELTRLDENHLHGLKIVLAPMETKNRRGAVLDLGPALAAELARIRGQWFPGTWWDRAAPMVRADLLECGVQPAARIDLHALRHTYITWCAGRWGVEVTQKLARHSTSVLTLDYYTHATPEYAQTAARDMESRLGCAQGVPGPPGYDHAGEMGYVGIS